MDELVKALRHFLVRDIVFILGGAEVILSFLYLFDRVPSAPPFTWALLFAGFAYILGYVAQDTASLLGIVRTQLRVEPNRLAAKLFEVFDRADPRVCDERGKVTLDSGESLAKIREFVRRFPDERIYASVERNAALKQVGTTFGSTSLFSGLLLAFRAIRTGHEFDIALAGSIIGLGILLVLLGWLKVTQQAVQVVRIYRSLKEERQDA